MHVRAGAEAAPRPRHTRCFPEAPPMGVTAAPETSHLTGQALLPARFW